MKKPKQKTTDFLGAASFGKEGAVGSNPTPRTTVLLTVRVLVSTMYVSIDPKKIPNPTYCPAC